MVGAKGGIAGTQGLGWFGVVVSVYDEEGGRFRGELAGREGMPGGCIDCVSRIRRLNAWWP